jgi:hypothetical protein
MNAKTVRKGTAATSGEPTRPCDFMRPYSHFTAMLVRMIQTPVTEAGHSHAVNFYKNQESLCHKVAEFLACGLIIHEPALVIAVPEHRAGIVDELHSRHFDVERMQAAGDLLLVDAGETLASFMVDGMPDAERFRTSATRLVAQVSRWREHCTIRAYGEMVDVLWKAGQNAAAAGLEPLWNQLALSHRVLVAVQRRDGQLLQRRKPQGELLPALRRERRAEQLLPV